MRLHVRRIGGEQRFVDGQLAAEAGNRAVGIPGLITKIAVVLVADRQHATERGVGRVLACERRAQLERLPVALERCRDFAALEQRSTDVVVRD